jgi:hypothetical protein
VPVRAGAGGVAGVVRVQQVDRPDDPHHPLHGVNQLLARRVRVAGVEAEAQLALPARALTL